jgi:hypothetical protein
MSSRLGYCREAVTNGNNMLSLLEVWCNSEKEFNMQVSALTAWR